MQAQLIDERLRQYNPLTKAIGDAGYDLFASSYHNASGNKIWLGEHPTASFDYSITIGVGETIKFGTGIKIWIKHPDLFAGIFARSKLGSNHNIVPANCVGVSDSSYQGEIIVALHNDGEEPYTVKPFEKIAQLLFIPITSVSFEWVQEFDGASERGEKGIMCGEERR